MISLINILEDREISRLKFNERVLEEAQNKNNPLYERIHFLSIFCNNLDEFYMVSDGTLVDTYHLTKELEHKKREKETKETMKKVQKYTEKLLIQKDIIYDNIIQQLKRNAVKQITNHNINDFEKDFLHQYFERKFSNVFVPIIVNKKFQFPFISNKQMFVAASLNSKEDNILGIVVIHSALPRMIFVPNSEKFRSYILIEDLIYMFLEDLFKKYRVEDKAIIRITRKADVHENEVIFDNDIDPKESISQLVNLRAKKEPVRLECIGSVNSIVINNIKKVLQLDKHQIFYQRAPLDMSFIQELKDVIPQQLYNSLYYEPFIPQKNPQIDENKSMIDQVMEKDILLSFPYEDYEQSIQLIYDAGVDSRVQSIQITLYRVSQNSKVIQALINAAQNGKEVKCIIELRARFDETENIGWANQLENGGCNVFYGLIDFKVHSKILLITMKNDEKEEFITQIGTGNYNETTAKVYCDLSLMTAHQEIGQECDMIFQKLQQGKLIENTKHLLVAPLCLGNRIEDLIDHEIVKASNGEITSIVLKLNGLTDRGMIKKLIQASQAGVKIKLFIRDTCCLKAGLYGVSYNIEVISIVGRFLEHSRIYKFGEGDSSRIYISSADLMKRNISHRVEVAVPIYHKECRIKICHLLEMIENDNVKARIQMPSGEYVMKHATNGEKQFEYQKAMMHEATQNNQTTEDLI
ncbi:MAG: polyphosphate kinase 1 [Lachnotalea sp.]